MELVKDSNIPQGRSKLDKQNTGRLIPGEVCPLPTLPIMINQDNASDTDNARAWQRRCRNTDIAVFAAIVIWRASARCEATDGSLLDSCPNSRTLVTLFLEVVQRVIGCSQRDRYRNARNWEREDSFPACAVWKIMHRTSSQRVSIRG